MYKGRFPLQPYRSETYRISLFREHSDRTNDMDTIEYATFRYDTAEVENGLKGRFPLQPYRSETYRILLFREHSDRTNDMDTIE